MHMFAELITNNKISIGCRYDQRIICDAIIDFITWGWEAPKLMILLDILQFKIEYVLQDEYGCASLNVSSKILHLNLIAVLVRSEKIITLISSSKFDSITM